MIYVIFLPPLPKSRLVPVWSWQKTPTDYSISLGWYHHTNPQHTLRNTLWLSNEVGDSEYPNNKVFGASTLTDMNVPSYLLFCLDSGIVEGDGIRTLRQDTLLQQAEPVLVIFSLGEAQPCIVSQPGTVRVNPGRPMLSIRTVPCWSPNAP